MPPDRDLHRGGQLHRYIELLFEELGGWSPPSADRGPRPRSQRRPTGCRRRHSAPQSVRRSFRPGPRVCAFGGTEVRTGPGTSTARDAPPGNEDAAVSPSPPPAAGGPRRGPRHSTEGHNRGHRVLGLRAYGDRGLPQRPTRHTRRPRVRGTPPRLGHTEVASDGGMFAFGGAVLRLDGRQAPQRPDRRHRRRPRRPAATGRWPPTAASSPSATPSSTARWAASPSTSRSWAWRPTPTAAATGRWPPTAASSPSATPRSTARWAASRSTRRSSAWPSDPDGRRLLGGGLRRRPVRLRQRPFYGSMGGKPLNKPIVGMAADRRRRRLLGGGLRRRALRLRRAPFLRLDGRQAAQQADRGHGLRPTAQAATGRWPPTAGSSPSAAPFYGSMGGKPLNAPVVSMQLGYAPPRRSPGGDRPHGAPTPPRGRSCTRG